MYKPPPFKQKAAFGDAALQKRLQEKLYKKFDKKQEKNAPIKADYRKLNRSAISCLPKLISRLGVTFRVVAGEIQMLNPHRQDTHFGSFSVNLKSGRWADFAVGDARGGDVVSLIAYIKKCRQSQAAEWIRSALRGGHA